MLFLAFQNLFVIYYTKLFLHLNLYIKSISYYPPVEKNIV